MIIRTKSGEFRAADTNVLLELLGVKNETGSVQKVTGDMELIAAVPLQLTVDTETAKGYQWTLSTYDLDRFSERIDPLGWDFKQFLKNPVVEWAHRYDIPAIGRIEGLTVDDSGLHGRVIFNDKDYDHFGWSIGQRVQAGVIRAGSVGFRIIEIEIPDRETAKDGTSLIIRKQELVEFSVCNVPANPYALAKREKRNEEREKEDESGGNAVTIWDCLINEE